MSQEKTDKEMQQELERQLHEQYAINNNSNLSSIVTLFVALIAVFGGYGYIFIHSSLFFNFEEIYDGTNGQYSLDALIFAAMAVFTVVYFMESMCLYQGYHQRYEQFITYAIRCKYYKDNPECIRPKLYPSNYNPFNKKGKDIPQGLFGEFLCYFCCLKILLIASLIIKLVYSIIVAGFNLCRISCIGIFEIILLIIIILGCEFLICRNNCKLEQKYNNLEEEFKEYSLNRKQVTMENNIENKSIICRCIKEIKNCIKKHLCNVVIILLIFTPSMNIYSNGIQRIAKETIELKLNYINDNIITFADEEVKAICVKNWDTNGDGELSYEEAAAVKVLGEVFRGTAIRSFDELQHFTSLTSIGREAFFGCNSLTSVTIPNSVTTIGYLSFAKCSSLTSISIPNSVTSIEELSFFECSGITSISIPNSVTSIGAVAFEKCSSLTSVTIPNSVTSIGDAAFNMCSSLTSVNIPNSVTSIGFGIFQYCSSLTSVILPNTLTKIGKTFFRGCSSLISVTIPNSVTSIDGSAFEGCTSLTSVIIPNSVTSIDEQAFYECASLASVTIPNSVTSIGREAFGNCSRLVSIALSNSVTSIRDYTFRGCSSLTSITIPNSVTSIGRFVFLDCKNLKEVHINDLSAWLNISYVDYLHGHPCCNGASLFIDGKEVQNVSIPNTIQEIKPYAFYGCSSITSVTIPSTVTSIGEGAFHNCSSLTSVIIPNSVTSIKDNTFYKCSGLTTVTIPNSVTSIGKAAFAYCNSLNSVTIPNSVTSIGESVFLGCSGLTTITIPNSVTSIGRFAFDNCSSLTSVTIPNSVTWIGQRTFRACSSLISVTIPNSVTSINEQAFYECTSLTSITIPNSVTSIGEGAFEKCSSLTSVIIPNSVTLLGGQTFYNCTRLASIVWDADFVMPSNVVNENTTNMLFYTKDASYAPSSIKNVIVNGTAKEIVLSDASSSNNFYCPREFTTEKISYTHNYRMTSGLDGQARGWETIALPFTVSEITHSSKGKLLPFGAWTSTSDAKPFWLCKLSSSGFTRATSIEANTPYIICMPNNSDYDSSFNLSGNVTFSATNVKVPVSSSVATVKSNSKTFIPAFCAQDKSSTVYALNVNNSYHSELGGYTEGSAFVSDLRTVSPFEAYMTTSAANAKRAFLIDFSETTGIDEVPTTDMKDGTHKIYNLNGQLVKQTNSQQELDETLKQLPAGVYVVNGKKTIVK